MMLDAFKYESSVSFDDLLKDTIVWSSANKILLVAFTILELTLVKARASSAITIFGTSRKFHCLN